MGGYQPAEGEKDNSVGRKGRRKRHSSKKQIITIAKNNSEVRKRLKGGGSGI